MANFFQYDGIIVSSFAFQLVAVFSANAFWIRSSMILTDVDAPGEAPNNVASVPSDATTTSVPNCKTPHFCGSALIICTR